MHGVKDSFYVSGKCRPKVAVGRQVQTVYASVVVRVARALESARRGRFDDIGAFIETYRK